MATDVVFVQVGELVRGITEYSLPDTGELAGRVLVLNREDGTALWLTFDSAQALTWQTIGGSDSGRSARVAYRATSPRANIFFVDYLTEDRRAASVSHVLDLDTQSATTVAGVLPSRDETAQGMFSRVTQGLEPTAVQAAFIRSTIDAPFTGPGHPHAPTADLIGRRIRYVYSRTEVYEHIYLNEMFYTWHCLAGVEKGLADTDRCHYYKIANDLYLFVWREKIVPTLGVVMIDLARMKTTGKLFGYQADDFGALTNAPIGAHATLVNITPPADVAGSIRGD